MLSVLFTINLIIMCVVGTYHMITRSNKALIYLISYGYGMCLISIIQIAGYIDLAFKLSILTIAIFACAVVFKTIMLIKENLKNKQHGADSTS